ncbi:MAG TPA: ATP-binding protein [Candidatus Binatia bacterium]|nr:ATP-binding protein [Candidatus Binatia bacterium]
MIAGRPDTDVQVLLLEDIDSDAELIREALQRSGIDVDVRQVDRRDSYVQALDARRPDVVLADHSVSTFRGIDALHLARERYPDVPFIFVSGAYGEQRVIESMKEGATDYVLKDHLVRLGPAVRRALDEAAHRRNQEQAEHRLRLLANGLPALISYIDPEWRYQFANEAYRHWFGTAPEELRGKRIWDVMGRAAFDAIRPYAVRALAGERLEFEALVPFKDGRSRWISASYTPDVGPDGKVAGIFVLANDISVRKKTEQSRAFLSEATGLLLSSLDYETTLADIARLAVPRVADWCSVCVEKGGQNRPMVMVHQDPARVDRLKEVLGRHPLPVDLPFTYPKVLRTGEWDLIPELTEEHLRAAAPDEGGRRLLREFGFRSVLTVPLVVAGRTQAALTLATAESGRRFTCEDVAFAEELARRAALAMENARLYRAARRESEDHKHAVEALRDLNEHLEQRVRERTVELEEITRELDAFASTVAHDLRSPLRVMKAFSEILVEDYSGQVLDVIGQEYALKIDRASDRMASLVESLLAYSRLARQDVPVHEVDLEAVVGAVVGDMADELRTADAEVSVERPLPRILGNEGLLAQVLGNLLSNAVKFRVPGRPCRVRIRAEAEAPEAVRLWVEDNGIGINPEHFERIFKVFERLHPQEAYPGSGLGLAIARRSVERVGGTIGVESEPGAGSRFWMRFRSPPEKP